MNCETPLSFEGSFEQIVNSGTAAKRTETYLWFRKKSKIVIALMAILLVNLCLWTFKVIPSVLSICFSEVLTCAIAFNIGRIYEKLCK